MAPPPSQQCSVPGCLYSTPENIPTWEMLTTHLNTHAQSVHQPPPAGNANTPSSKTAKKNRPSITNQMSEETWRFFLDEWGRYKRQTVIKDQELLDELWSCMTDELRQLAFAEGGTSSLATEEAMTARIKSLAVVTLHSSVHVVNLHELRQQSDENVHAFAARVRGIAASCNLQKKCNGCQAVVTFSEETCFHVVMAGICDQEMKEKALTQAMMETITDLNSLVKWCTADESGRLGVTGQSSIAPLRQSLYKKQLKTKTCHNCGQKRHGDGTPQAREKNCKAFGKTCSKCGKNNHFSSVCKSTSPAGSNNAISTEETATEADSHGALHFRALHHTKPNTSLWRPWESRFADQVNKVATHKKQTEPIFTYSVPTANRFSALTEEPVREHTIPSSTPDLDVEQTTKLPDQRDTRILCRPKVISPRKQATTLPGLPDITASPYPLPQCIPTNPAHLAALVQDMTQSGSKSVKTVPLPHMLHDVHAGWIKSRPRKSPDMPVTIRLHLPSYKNLGLTVPTFSRKLSNPARSITKSSIMDSGAQMNVCPESLLSELHIKPDTIFPLQARIEGASSEPITLTGGIIVEISGKTATGQPVSTLQLMYVSKAVKYLYLSLNACVGLRVVPADFPQIGSCPPNAATHLDAISAAISRIESTHTKCTNTGIIQPGTEKCSCPARALPPHTPPQLPCAPTEENLPKLKKFILDRFAASAFNTCQRQPLPLMEGSPPLRLHVDSAARPVAVHQPAQVPLHWRDAVKGGLDRDVRLGVLEQVDVNEPVAWCSRMVVTPKQNGEPRRVVDFQALNDHAPRQTHHTETPWSLVSSIPPNQVKTVLDCFHGYHSVPIAEEDRPYTTFLTPYGRYRYKTCPQGFLAAGDAYSHRMDLIVGDTPRLKKCIDDSLLYDSDIATNFFRVCQFLEKCSSQGCVFNPEKFQFGENTVKFLGFNVNRDSVTPTEDFLQNIRSFPTPKTITDIRSWYGAIAQISYAFSTAPIMQPFRHLLSTKAPFQWSPDLDQAFQASKEEIVRQCLHGVKSFDPNLPTALATDWSKLAMGFWLCQKHCKCQSTKPGCCDNGWQTVYVGSRFCTSAESRYAPIEGEMLAAVWAMGKCKFFLLGMKSFILAMDHKPLISMLGPQPILDIPNPRLVSCKIKSLMYSFMPTHIPGKLHVVPDSLSRRSDSPIPHTTTSETMILDTTNVHPEYQNNCSPPSWVSTPATNSHSGVVAALCIQPTHEEEDMSKEVEQYLTGSIMSALASLDEDPWQDVSTMAPIRQQPAVLSLSRLEAAAASCPTYSQLRSLIQSGAPEDKNIWPALLLPYYQHRHSLVAVGQVVLLHDRPVIPVSLREEVLDHLHAAHHCVTTMYARATTCMYWPNMREDIVKSRAACSSCNLNAPSNPAPPPHPVQHPWYPFSDICADFFAYSSKSYLVVVDRYSNWLSLFQLADDNTANVIKTLRTYFSTWGVPHSLSTDGDPVFTSHELKTWLKRWDVHHRVSSAYYPRSNKRAEVAVKSGKRMIMDNLGPGGTLHTDRIARALLQHRNCPDTATGLSPAQVIFGRVLKDHLSLQPNALTIRPEWRLEADLREKALSRRHLLKHEQLSHGSKQLPPLQPGDVVMLQDQASPKQPGKWTRTGRVTEAEGFDSYIIKMDGSHRVTKRNRRFLRKVVPFMDVIQQPIQPAPPLTTPTTPVPSSTPPSPEAPPPTRPPPVTTNPKQNKTHVKEKWIVAKKPQPQSANVHKHTNISDIIDDTSDVSPDTNNATPANSVQNYSPPIFLSQYTPQLPGTCHDYTAMDSEFARLRQQAAASKQ